jgi:peroxiredoxin
MNDPGAHRETTKMRKCLLSCVLTLVAASAAFGQDAKRATDATADKADAPPFNVTTLDGKKISLASLGGKVVVLNFWFTGCPPCVEEIPKLNALAEEFKGKDVVFLALTWDDAPTVRAFLKDVPFKYEVVPGAADVIIGSYSKGGEVVFPTHYVIDRGGKVELRTSGVKDLDALRDAIKRLADSPSK